MRRISPLVLLCLTLTAFIYGIYGQSPLAIRLQPYVTGLSLPTLIRNANDGSKRMFILEQKGTIKVVAPGSSTPTMFMDITSKVSQNLGEQGLLGLAFDPQFSTNHYFFVDYTRAADGATIVSRYSAINNNTQGDPASERVLYAIADPYPNHNGGMLEFGPDGYLYNGLGDGGSANDPENRSQNINEYWGKMLRIIPDVSGVNTNPPYTVPADNPYAGATPGLDEIYALGLRNPWRWSFDRGGTHQLWVADVGQNAIEEVDIVTRGGNYGWRVYEGNQCTGNDPTLCIPGNYIMPIFQYPHELGRCAITGGYVYRGTQNTLPNGAYTYADYCTGEIWIWNNNASTLLLDSPRFITSFGEGEDGELYVVGQGSGSDGTVDKIVRARASGDFDGDAKTDVGVYRPSEGVWYIANSSNSSFKILKFGLAEDIPAAADFDGDNVTDIGLFRPSTGTWYYIRSSDSTVGIVQFGSNGDEPAAGDYDGDAKADLTLYRPSTGVWYTLRSSDGTATATQFGLSQDIPTPGDFDGDGKFDIAVWRPSEGVWYRLNSSNGTFSAVQFGSNGDVPAAGDFDGDGRDDPTLYRPSTGVWYTLQSTTGGFTAIPWGVAEDIPAVGDYDGDGKEDIAVFRPSTGVWYVRRSSDGALQARQFGTTGDLPIPKYAP
jgi:glucose/arabinose dehydrogenase